MLGFIPLGVLPLGDAPAGQSAPAEDQRRIRNEAFTLRQIRKPPPAAPIPGAQFILGTALNPASGEGIYDTLPTRAKRPAEPYQTLNQFSADAVGKTTELVVSLDAMREALPRCSTVALLCSWFGSSVDANTCTISPRTIFQDGVFQDFVNGQFVTRPWRVSSLEQDAAELIPITQVGGEYIYGGTPTDRSIFRAIPQ